MHAPDSTRHGRRRRAFALIAAIGALNLLGFALLLAIVPQHLTLANGSAFGLSLGLSAWMLGSRHAFDADHIAAIDGVTRKLTAEGTDALPAGFFFALGHSTVVVGLGALVAVGIDGIGGALADDGSTLHLITGTWGPAFAGVFLLTVGILNLVALRGLVRALRAPRGGPTGGHELERRLEENLERRGVLARLYSRATRSITAPWQMYPVGLLFGFGFDTATEIALLVLAGGAAASGLPFYAVMCLPALFTAGMVLFDTLNTTAMTYAYDWSFAKPARRIYYSLTVTAITVAGAIVVGTLSLAHAFVSVDMRYAGFALFAVFMSVWLVSAAIWKFGRVEERLSTWT